MKWSSNSAKYSVSESSYEPRTFPISYKCGPLYRVSRSTSATIALLFTLDQVQIQNFTCHETLRCPRYPGYQLLPLGNCEQTLGKRHNDTKCHISSDCNSQIFANRGRLTNVCAAPPMWLHGVMDHVQELALSTEKITRPDFAELHPQHMIRFFFCSFAKTICINPPVNFATSVYPSVS
jgi:hypothetical protein